MTRRRGTAAAVLSFLLLAGSATRAGAGEAGPPDGQEAFRAEVRSLVDDLAGSTRLTGTPGAAEAAREAVDAMSPAALEALRNRLEQVPHWQRLPEVVARLEATRPEPAAARAAAAGAGSEAERLERFRSDLLVLVERFRAFAPLVADPDFDARLDRLEANVEGFPAAGLPTLEAVYRRRAPTWKAQLLGLEPASRGTETDAAPGSTLGEKALFNACDKNCGALDFACLGEEISCDIGKINQEIDRLTNLISDAVDGFFRDVAEVFDDVAALPGQIEGFFVGLAGEIESFLLASLDTLAGPVEDLLAVSSPADALALLGLDGLDAAFFEDLARSVPKLDLPCPPMDTDIPGIGVVGSARAEYVCKRGVDWVSHLVYDVVPDDVLDVPLKIPATFVYYPINYFCLCMEAQSTRSFKGAQSDHRDHVAVHLDARLSTRATGVSVQTLQASLEALGPHIDRLSGSVATAQAGVDDVDADVAQVEAKLDVLDPKVDSIADSQDEQTELLEAFREIELRLDVEEGLLNEPGRTLAALQAPEADAEGSFGGFLGRVREIVVETIAMSTVAGVDARLAERELARGDAEFSAGAWERAFDHYRKAYLAVTR